MFDKLRNRRKNLMPKSVDSKPLATLDAGDLRKFQEQRKVIGDQARLLSMLQMCYTSFLADVQVKYNVPEAISVNIQTGEVREALPEQTDV